MERALFIGGIKSGKTALAQKWLQTRARNKIYLATGEAMDEEMTRRIEAHRAQRGEDWKTIEEPVHPELSIPNGPMENASGIMLDCVSSWVGNLLHRKVPSSRIFRQVALLVQRLTDLCSPCAVVTLECGMGIIPANALSREFIDLMGVINQQMAVAMDNVYMVNCGIPLLLKGEPI